MTQSNNENDNFGNIIFMQADPSNYFQTTKSNLETCLKGRNQSLNNLLGWQVSFENVEIGGVFKGKVKFTKIGINGNPVDSSYLEITSCSMIDEGVELTTADSIIEKAFFPEFAENADDAESGEFQKMGFYFISFSDYDFLTLNSVSEYVFSISILDFGKQYVEEGAAVDFDLIPVLKIESIFSGLIPTYSAPRILLAPPCPPMWRPKLEIRIPRIPPVVIGEKVEKFKGDFKK